MNRRNIIYAICFLMAPFSFSESNICKNVFNIPEFSGMVDASASTDAFLSNANTPTSTRLRVFKTSDGSPIDQREVVDFYQSYYRERGWHDGISARQGDESYLNLTINSMDLSSSTSTIQYSGDLYLWVSPQDGMLTVYMKIWRNSGLRQVGTDTFKKTEVALKAKAVELGYNPMNSFQYSWVNEFFQNEYLISSKLYTLDRNSYPASEGLSHCTDSSGRIHIRFLTYKDSVVANEVAQTLKNDTRQKTGVVKNRIPRLYQREVVQKGFMLVLIENRDESQTNAVTQIINAIKEVQ